MTCSRSQAQDVSETDQDLDIRTHLREDATAALPKHALSSTELVPATFCVIDSELKERNALLMRLSLIHIPSPRDRTRSRMPSSA